MPNRAEERWVRFYGGLRESSGGGWLRRHAGFCPRERVTVTRPARAGSGLTIPTSRCRQNCRTLRLGDDEGLFTQGLNPEAGSFSHRQPWRASRATTSPRGRTHPSPKACSSLPLPEILSSALGEILHHGSPPPGTRASSASTDISFVFESFNSLTTVLPTWHVACSDRRPSGGLPRREVTPFTGRPGRGAALGFSRRAMRLLLFRAAGLAGSDIP